MSKFWIVIGCIAYVISPIDFLPEAIFLLFGYVDDLAVVIMTLAALGSDD